MTREDIAKLPDVGEGLENRIADAAVRCSTSSEIADLVKTKRYTHARIRRILACALLGIEKAHTQIPIEYVPCFRLYKRGGGIAQRLPTEYCHLCKQRYQNRRQHKGIA